MLQIISSPQHHVALIKDVSQMWHTAELRVIHSQIILPGHHTLRQPDKKHLQIILTNYSLHIYDWNTYKYYSTIENSTTAAI